MREKQAAIGVIFLIQFCLMIGKISSFSTIRRSRASFQTLRIDTGLLHIGKSSTFQNTMTSPSPLSLPLPLHSTTRRGNAENFTGSDSTITPGPGPGNLETDEEKLMQDILFRIRECNKISEDVRASLMDFIVDDTPVGKITQKVATLLCNSSPSPPGQETTDPVFEIVNINSDPSNGDGNQNGNDSSSQAGQIQILTLTESAGSTPESRTDAVMSVMTNLKSEGIIKGWRDELYPVSDGFYNDPLFFVERASAPFLGIMQYGVHINGIVKSHADEDVVADKDVDDGMENMWIARRSPTKSTYPSMTDQIVAGGQGAGLGLMENVLKGKFNAMLLHSCGYGPYWTS